VDTVLVYLDSLPPIELLDFKHLTYRTLMLLALLTGQRCHALHAITVNDLKFSDSKCVIVFNALMKQSRPGVHLKPIELLPFSQNRKLCVVSHLKEYVKVTEDLRRNNKRLFLTLLKPYNSVSKDTIARWVKTVLGLAGIDTKKFGAHSTRSASTSAAAQKGVSLATILRTAGWSRQNTFSKFYNKAVSNEENFGQVLLDKFLKK